MRVLAVLCLCVGCVSSLGGNSTKKATVASAYVGGGPCSTSDDCNYGTCSGGKCSCFYGFTCPDCSGGCQAQIGGFWPDDCENMCGLPDPSIPVGGATCFVNGGCGGGYGGHCVAQQCVCYPGYVCIDCSLPLSSYVDESSCSTETSTLFGGGSCSTGADCGGWNGQCVGGVCQCNWGMTCPTCSEQCLPDTTKWPQSCSNDCGFVVDPSGNVVAVGGMSCTSTDECYHNVGGYCSNGRCQCYDGWACQDCSEVAGRVRNGSRVCRTVTRSTSTSAASDSLLHPILALLGIVMNLF